MGPAPPRRVYVSVGGREPGRDGEPERERAAELAEPAEPAELRELAVDVARQAGGLLLERFRAGNEQALASKSTPTDLVSEADLASERLVRELLGRARPHDGFLGEEGGGESGSSGLTWIVDPLDGTINFLFGIPQWSVSVAVADSQRTLAGAIFDPCSGELFSAARGGAALLEGAAAGPGGEVARPDERTIGGSRREDLASALIATGLAYDARVRDAQGAVLQRLLPRVRDIRRFGSAALDLAWTAAGRYDGYFERSVKPWDIAAGVLICECAGLEIARLEERELLPAGILVAAPALARPLLELVR